MEPFWNRVLELKKTESFLGKGAFAYVTGRRRIGKTELLKHFCKTHDGVYHQAIEATTQQQLEQLALEIRDRLSIFQNTQPRSWQEFFSLLSREKLPKVMVFDEFPYWVKSAPELPSILQKWIDHDLPKKRTLLMVSGSSQSMLYAQFLRYSSPLYGRAQLHLHLDDMSYQWFCRALKYPLHDHNSFVRYSLVGGIPHYWKILPKTGLIRQAEKLYFESGAILAEEPSRILYDEGITGSVPKALLDLIGQGVSKPSEIAGRMGVPQPHLSRPLSLLLELRLIQRELPYGESIRTTKKVLYSLHDPALSFYYGAYLPFRARWPVLSDAEKFQILNQHASKHWEIFCRKRFAGAARYWEGNIEIDLVAPLNKNECLVAECKWTSLSRKEESNILRELQEKFYRSSLGKKIKAGEFAVFSKKDL